MIVKYNGDVTWLTPALLIAKCPMNIKYFPFDEQKCTLEFGSWTYDGSQINLDVRGPKMSESEQINTLFSCVVLMSLYSVSGIITKYKIRSR